MDAKQRFHLHIDATLLPLKLEKRVKEELGFGDTDFSGHPEGYRHFEPERHLTRKFGDKSSFLVAFQDLSLECSKTGFIGYIEGEFVISDIKIPAKPYNPDVHAPFSVTRRLLAGAPTEPFRETELHLVMDNDCSDPRIIRALLDSGLYGAYIPKSDYTAVVLTAQGRHSEIATLTGAVWNYVNEAGGAVRCTLKEEQAIAYNLSGMNHAQLPEVVKKIEYRDLTTVQRANEALTIIRQNSA